MKAQQTLEALESHEKGTPIPAELIVSVIGLIPQLFELISRKPLKKRVEAQEKLIQVILQKNSEQDLRIEALEKK